ncbi:MAG: diguanylate cyclase, partial [Paracoccaceae bacterium]
MLYNLILPGLMVVICTASAFAALLLIGFLDRSGPRRVRHELVPENAVEPTVFLFSDGTLIDATGPARRLLEKLCRHGGEWESLLAYLGPKLPNAAAALDSLSESGQILLTSESEPDFCLFAEHLGSAIRLT